MKTILLVVITMTQLNDQIYKYECHNCCDLKPFTYTVYSKDLKAVSDTFKIQIKN